MSSHNNIKFNYKCREVYVGVELNSKSSVISDLSSVSTFLLGKSDLQGHITKENAIKTHCTDMDFGGKFNNTKFNTIYMLRDLSISLKSISNLEDLEDSISQYIKGNGNLYLYATKHNVIIPSESNRKFAGDFNNTKFNTMAKVKYLSIHFESISSFKDLENNISINLKGKSNLKSVAISKNVFEVNSLDDNFGGNFNSTRFNTKYRLKNLSIYLSSIAGFKDLDGSIHQTIEGNASLYVCATKESVIELYDSDKDFGGSFNNTKFNTVRRGIELYIDLRGVSSFNDLEDSISQSIISKSSLEACAIKENVINVDKLKRQVDVSFNTTYRTKHFSISLKGVSSFIDLESSISSELISKSNLRLIASSKKDINLNEINRRFAGSFNNTRFNVGDKIKYISMSLNGVSRFKDIEGNTAINFIGRSNLRVTPTSKNDINVVSISGRFGGSFNNVKFNIGDKVNYTSISLRGKSQFKDLVGNISISLTGNSNLKANSNRIRHPNNSLKPMFESKSTLMLNAHLEISSGISFKAKSYLESNAYKYMWSITEFKAISEISLSNFKVTFTNLTIQGRSNINFNVYVVSQESLILEDIQFKPNDVIEIDLDNYYITHNGVDITYKMSGVFFRFYPDTNTLYWKDNVNERNVRKDILYQNKFL